MTCGAVLLCVSLAALLFHAFNQDGGVEVPTGRIHDAGVFDDDIVAHDSSGGEIIIGGKGNKSDAKPLSATNITLDPEDIWQESSNAGSYTLTEQAQMQSDNIGVLTIPDLRLIVNVYESPDNDNMEAMEKGVAHFYHTSAWEGNVAMSAHNVNLDGSPGYFLNLHQLQKGAIIRYETALGVREYAVETISQVNENDWSMLDRSDTNKLTLVTCITGRPDMRLIVQAIEVPS